MKRFRTIISALFVLAILVGLLWLFYKGVGIAYRAFASLNPNLAVAIVAGSATILGSTLAVVLTRYYQSKREREVAHRDKKIELYDELLAKLFTTFLADSDRK